MWKSKGRAHLRPHLAVHALRRTAAELLPNCCSYAASHFSLTASFHTQTNCHNTQTVTTHYSLSHPSFLPLVAARGCGVNNVVRRTQEVGQASGRYAYVDCHATTHLPLPSPARRPAFRSSALPRPPAAAHGGCSDSARRQRLAGHASRQALAHRDR